MAKLNANSIELGSLTTSQRNSLSAATGEVIYNSTTGAVESYNGSEWIQLSNLFNATGGTVSTSGGNKIHTFTSPGTFSVTGNGSVQYLVIGGGGGGGSNGRSDGSGGGGGAGALRYSSSQTFDPASMPLSSVG